MWETEKRAPLQFCAGCNLAIGIAVGAGMTCRNGDGRTRSIVARDAEKGRAVNAEL